MKKILVGVMVLVMGFSLCACGDSTGNESNDNTNDMQSISIDESEDVSDAQKTDTEKSEPSKEEETYLLAQEAMNNNQYGYALRLFNGISDYKDSADCIASLHTIVDSYNGEYTVEMFAGGTYNMVINDGIVTTQINDVDGALLYYFELFGFTYDDGTIGMAMGNASDYDSDGIIDTTPSISYEGDERYSIKSMDNGGLMIMALEGNGYTYWNGSTK